MSETQYRVFRGFPPLKDPHSLPAGPILAVAPHPDDEIIGCGGTMAFHAERGDDVVVVHMTGGERGDPQGLQNGNLVAVRQRESKAALQELGVEHLVGLNFPDGALEPSEEVIDRLVEEINRYSPVVVYAPSPLECHPDHLATCWAVAKALARTPLIVEFYCYEVNHPTMASFLVDITPRVNKKRESLMQFKSQQRYQDIVGKCLASAYARTVNVDLPEIQYAEAFWQLRPEELPAVWKDLETLLRRTGIAVHGNEGRTS